MRKIKIYKKRLKFRVFRSFIVEVKENVWWSREAGQTVESLPKCLSDLLEKKKLVTRGIGNPAEFNENEYDLGRPFSEEQLSEDGFGNTRIAALCTITLKWEVDGKYDGAHRFTANAPLWVRSDIAEDVIAGGFGKKLAWPLKLDPREKLSDVRYIELGSYDRKKREYVAVDDCSDGDAGPLSRSPRTQAI